MTKVKFCGLTREEDIACANELLPDYIGFVFAPKSKRYITPERAHALKGKLDDSILAVGVFVDEEPERIAGLLQNGVIDIAQLHGQESEAYMAELRKLTDKPLIKAFSVASSEDVERAGKSSADFVLLDSGSGGSGKVFDWSLIREFDKCFFLAGGLHLGNVRQAVEEAGPYAVDVSSGIETDGVKDREKMRALMRALGR